MSGRTHKEVQKEYPCAFIQDLLPAYIDSIAGSETNKLVSEHLSICDDCRNVLECMKDDEDANTGAGKSPDAFKDNPARVVDYMQKLRRRRRTTMLVVSACIFLLAAASVFAIRAHNLQMRGCTGNINTGEMLVWPEGETGERFLRNGTEYVCFEKFKYMQNTDVNYGGSVLYAEERARFNIKEDMGFWGWLFGTDGRSTMRVVEEESGAEIYQSNGNGLLYIKKGDEDKADKYFSNIENYRFELLRAEAGREEEEMGSDTDSDDEDAMGDVSYQPILLDFSNEEKHLVAGLKESMATKTIQVKGSEIAMMNTLDFSTSDGMITGSINLLRHGGKWYWASDYDWYSEDEGVSSSCTVYELPSGMANKLEDAYNSEETDEV